MPSDLQVSNIKDLTGSNTGLSIASDGQVTITQNNPTIQLGSNATGFTGIKTVDGWYLSTDLTGTNAPIAYSNYTRGTTSNGLANFGTGMTLNDVSGDGVFSFPSTGIWKVEFRADVRNNNKDRVISIIIDVSTSGTGGTFSAVANARTHTVDTSTTWYSGALAIAYLDVTDTDTSTGTVVQFDFSPNNSNTILDSDSNLLRTAFIFTRLGDT